jgi:hypothetical protein
MDMTTNDKMKRKYEKPAFRTIELQHCTQLLQMSGDRGYQPTDVNPFGGDDD